MFQWLFADSKRQAPSRSLGAVASGLQQLYREKVLPLERDHDFKDFQSQELTDADFAAKPVVMLLGQYSTGKTSLIQHLLGGNYPGSRIGPEPTTDRFVAITHSDSDHDTIIPGHALVTDPNLPFEQLSRFGQGFLGRFECAKVNNPVLEGVTFIDTPGVLAGEKQRVNRGYDFEEVIKWFAHRADVILLLFDVSKLDIADEFRRVILAVKRHDHKIHIILNKADCVTTSQLMRVYGALMWTLGKLIDTAEVSRVYVGSFWPEPLQNPELQNLFKLEEHDLYSKLSQLPRTAAVRKLNELIIRTRQVKVHALILECLRNKMPWIWRPESKQNELITNLKETYDEIRQQHNIPSGDFPDLNRMQKLLAMQDFKKFAKLDPQKIDGVNDMLSTDLPSLLELVPAEEQASNTVKFMPLQRAKHSRSGSRSRSRSPRRLTN